MCCASASRTAVAARMTSVRGRDARFVAVADHPLAFARLHRRRPSDVLTRARRAEVLHRGHHLEPNDGLEHLPLRLGALRFRRTPARTRARFAPPEKRFTRMFAPAIHAPAGDALPRRSIHSPPVRQVRKKRAPCAPLQRTAEVVPDSGLLDFGPVLQSHWRISARHLFLCALDDRRLVQNDHSRSRGVFISRLSSTLRNPFAALRVDRARPHLARWTRIESTSASVPVPASRRASAGAHVFFGGHHGGAAARRSAAARRTCP